MHKSLMTKRCWIDTCIWRDFYEDRFSKIGNHLGEYATKFFMKVLKNKDKILFSESLVWELKKHHTIGEINNMLNIFVFAKVLIRVDIKAEEVQEAKELSQKRNAPFTDCLIAVQARNNNAIVVSQDRHFFKDLMDIVKAVRPN